MKCVFVVPPWTHKDSHFEALQDTVAGYWPPAGILYLAAVARESGHKVAVLDGAMMGFESMLKQIVLEKPDFIGISSVAVLWEHTKELSKSIREKLPNVKITAGGQGPTFLKERCLEECQSLDFVVTNEGENTIRSLLASLESNEEIKGLKGVYYRDHGEIAFHGNAEYVKDLDSLPFPAIDLIDAKWYVPSVGQYRKLPVGEIMSSRGCPNNCIFCFKIGGNHIRMRSSDNILGEIEYWIDLHKIREIKFWDENFTHNKNRVIEICEGIIKKKERHGKKWDIVWTCSGRIDGVNDEMLRLMKRSGCWCIQYGIESGVQKNLDTLKKHTTVEQARRTVALTHKYGITMINTFILGIPGETYEEALETVQFAKELNSDFVEFFPCTPFPGTELYNNIAQYGHLLEPDITKLGMHLLPFVPYSMDEAQLRYLQQAAFKGYYMRVRYIWQRLKKIRSWFDIKMNFAGLRALLKMHPKKANDSFPKLPVVDKK